MSSVKSPNHQEEGEGRNRAPLSFLPGRSGLPWIGLRPSHDSARCWLIGVPALRTFAAAAHAGY